MGSKDRFSDNKLLDDFAVGRSNPTRLADVYLQRRPTWLSKLQRVDYSDKSTAARDQEQLSTRVGYGRVHSIIENIFDKCGVIAPNLPTKTDDLSHSICHG
uniref:Uncharacterized protein n=1 Tax=Oryza sativa subsp. japonica TaxID=39947 RepID=Q2QXR4_ORYSJ|nr:hypothetical protein LOC_Os12g05144 [Oryza sativa Japonica Group]